MTPRIKKIDFKVQVEEPKGSGNFIVHTLQGTPLYIEGYEGVTFIYHRFLKGFKGSRVSELRTGARVNELYDYTNKADAIADTKRILDQECGNVEKLKRRIRYIRDKFNNGKWLNEPLRGQGRLL